jgi:hypothetical protein
MGAEAAAARVKLTERLRLLQTLRNRPRSKRSQFVFLAKVLVAATLLAVAFWNIDLRGQLATWTSLNPWHFAMTCAAILLGQFFAALRWIVVLRRWDLPLSVWQAYRLNLSGLFFNLAFPSSIGGDVVRVFFLSRFSGKGTESVMRVLLTRVAGLVVLLLMGVVSALVFASSVLPPLLSALAAISVAVGVVVAVFAVRSEFAGRWVTGEQSGIVGKVRQAVGSLQILGHDTRAMIEITSLSFLVQIVSIIGFYEAARAIGVETSFVNFLVFMPIIIVFSMIPISIFGLGLRENAFVFLFGMVGIGEALSVSMSLTWFLAYLAVGVASGLVLITLDQEFFIGKAGVGNAALREVGAGAAAEQVRPASGLNERE